MLLNERQSDQGPSEVKKEGADFGPNKSAGSKRKRQRGWRVADFGRQEMTAGDRNCDSKLRAPSQDSATARGDWLRSGSRFVSQLQRSWRLTPTRQQQQLCLPLNSTPLLPLPDPEVAKKEACSIAMV